MVGPRASAYLRLLKHEATKEYFYSPLDGMLVHRRVTPALNLRLFIFSPGCLAQEHNTMTRPELEPRPLDPESSALTVRPPHLPRVPGFALNNPPWASHSPIANFVFSNYCIPCFSRMCRWATLSEWKYHKLDGWYLLSRLPSISVKFGLLLVASSFQGKFGWDQLSRFLGRKWNNSIFKVLDFN